MSMIMTIPVIMDNNSEYILFVILQDRNIERIKGYDPAEINISDMPKEIQRMDLKAVHLLYATKEEFKEIMDHPENCMQMLKKLARGWQFRPDLGDADELPEPQGPFYTK